MKPDYYRWNPEKNLKLKAERGISFEQVTMHIEQGNLIDIVVHPDSEKYPGQKILIVEIDNYAYLVPFVEDDNGIFLKTIIPSRKATRIYLGGTEENDKT
jgi:hypothetical protein